MSVLEATWRWRLAHSPEALWPVLSDTARYNEVIGVPKHRIDERLDRDGRVRFFGEARFGPFTMRWEDSPVNWVRNQWHEHVRVFAGGPFRLFAAALELAPAAGGAECTYRIRLEPRGLLGRPICGRFLAESERKIGTVVEGAERYLAGERPRPFAYRAPRVEPAVARRVGGLVEAIEAGGYGHGLAERLARFVLEGQEVDLARIRPLALARAWGVAPRVAVEACLAAARAGLLGSRWEILCPRCRVGKAPAAHLDALANEAHCTSCNIHYDRDFARNVELTFHPAPGVRSIAHGEFCWLGPSSTPHIVAQVTLAPGESRVLAGTLAPGAYRARTLAAGAQADFEWDAAGLPAVSVDAGGVCADAAPGTGEAGFHNRGDAVRTVVIEEREWVRDALTAHRVTTLQAFRDLFSSEVLRPGDDVAVEHVTFMFTDLEGSSALYNRVGDASAYHMVREHFALLGEVVREHDGSIVKMVGDGIHAAFADPGDAVRCALAIQRRASALAERPGLEDMRIRIGLHCGPSISVTINDRLDYYGAAVNLAARLQGRCAGGEIVVSEPFARDAAAEAALAGLTLEPGAAPLKGFAGETAYYRVLAPASDPGVEARERT